MTFSLICCWVDAKLSVRDQSPFHVEVSTVVVVRNTLCNSFWAYFDIFKSTLRDGKVVILH